MPGETSDLDRHSNANSDLDRHSQNAGGIAVEALCLGFLPSWSGESPVTGRLRAALLTELL